LTSRAAYRLKKTRSNDENTPLADATPAVSSLIPTSTTAAINKSRSADWDSLRTVTPAENVHAAPRRTLLHSVSEEPHDVSQEDAVTLPADVFAARFKYGDQKRNAASAEGLGCGRGVPFFGQSRSENVVPAARTLKRSISDSHSIINR
jgi:hypothetical protein